MQRSGKPHVLSLLCCGLTTASALFLAPLGAQSADSSNSTPVDPVTTPTVTHKIETGVTYSRGDYGLNEDTEVLVVPFTYTLEFGEATLRATAPWLHVSGPASVINGGASGGGPSRPNADSTSGLGDSSLGLSYHFNPVPDEWNIDGTVRVKFPTGDEDRGLGTGEMDYYGQLDFYRVYGKFVPFGVVGYRVLGDGRYQLDDGLYATLGNVFILGGGRSLAVSLDWRDALSAGADDSLESGIYLITRHSEHWSSTVGGLVGFTDASPAYGLSGSVGYTF